MTEACPLPRVTVKIPTQLRAPVGGSAAVSVRGDTVAAVFAAVDKHFPDFIDRICLRGEGGVGLQLSRFVHIYVNGEDIRFQDGLQTRLSEGDEVTVLPTNAGG